MQVVFLGINVVGLDRLGGGVCTPDHFVTGSERLGLHISVNIFVKWNFFILLFKFNFI
jgi:hypothetical protein